MKLQILSVILLGKNLLPSEIKSQNDLEKCYVISVIKPHAMKSRRITILSLVFNLSLLKSGLSKQHRENPCFELK